MITKEQVKNELKKLVQKFEEYKGFCTSKKYDESSTRSDYMDHKVDNPV